MKLKGQRTPKSYNPNLGYIGKSKINVSNYIFSSSAPRRPYKHSTELAHTLLKTKASHHLKNSQNLSEFIRRRDLTFQKTDENGNYKIFPVPCTTTVVPLQKSIFNKIEKAAQVLISSLRLVLQDIYSSKTLEDSSFIRSLPLDLKRTFLKAVKNSPNYFPQLHHPDMEKYPFFDNVGLDLVLTEDYGADTENLPFKILEINAGSPSGAANNMNVLEGLNQQNPEYLNSFTKVMPNDHFEILAETYKSLGEAWTGIKDGIQIILPPGGMNGAAPEIHNLAAYSGLVYADAVQLFADDKGYIRLRTINGSNPIVTAIYSRINADAALYDPDRNLLLKDPETNKTLYLRDGLKLGVNGEAPLIKDSNGNSIPLQSDYAVPGLLDAILQKKIYMGGLNRVLDNKIILTTLTEHAPRFFQNKIKCEEKKSLLQPPQTLPSTAESIKEIEKNPNEWVIKEPNLSGGSGIYILKTIESVRKKKIIEMAKKNPGQFAYQKLVKIARIPVAKKSPRGTKFVNLAADIRMWAFFGGGEDNLPKLSHNALVRYAPEEKGPLSSIVNTSKGGGYAPFIIVDDTNSELSVTLKEFFKPRPVKELKTELPIFVAAQLLQASRLTIEIHKEIKKKDANRITIYELLVSLKNQCREIVSFIDPKAMEPIHQSIHIVEKDLYRKKQEKYIEEINKLQFEIVKILPSIEARSPFAVDVRNLLDHLHILDQEFYRKNYNAIEQAEDQSTIKKLITLAKTIGQQEFEETVKKLAKVSKKERPVKPMNPEAKKAITKEIMSFESISSKRLCNSIKTRNFSSVFKLGVADQKLTFNPILTSPAKELNNLEIKSARESWLIKLDAIEHKSEQQKITLLKRLRNEHFRQHPKIAQMNEIIRKGIRSTDDLIKLLPAMPFAKRNIEYFCRMNNIELKQAFTHELVAKRVCLLSSNDIRKNHLSAQEHAGECFAKKRKSHGLFSDSDTFMWIRNDIHPLTLIYTIGHEIIHFYQIEKLREYEAKAIKTSPIDQALFLNYYGNFLGIAASSLENLTTDITIERRPLYGLADRIIPYFNVSIIKELRQALNKSAIKFDRTLEKYGSSLGYMMPNSNQVRVKALQEVIPAWENAKNILHAKELGLDIQIDEIQSALPTANKNQLELYRPILTKALKKDRPDLEVLKIIANHQFYGVHFNQWNFEDQTLILKPQLTTISLGSSYNQTQQ